MSRDQIKMSRSELMQLKLFPIKRSVSVFSSDPSCKDGNARFTTVLLKDFYVKYKLDIYVSFLKTVSFYLYKLLCESNVRISSL